MLHVYERSRLQPPAANGDPSKRAHVQLANDSLYNLDDAPALGDNDAEQENSAANDLYASFATVSASCTTSPMSVAW